VADDDTKHNYSHGADLLSIGEFANASLLSHKALRLYAQLGLLSPTHIDTSSGYRYYHRDLLDRARLIRMLRDIDMPLAEIRQVLAADNATQAGLIRAYRQSIDRHAHQVRATVQRLLSSTPYKEHQMSPQVDIEQLAAQPIASISKHIFIDALDNTIRTSLAQLNKYAASYGGGAGVPFGIFHGPINHQDNGPIEVCLPLTAEHTPDGDVTVRILPAGNAACVTMRGDDCEFPVILSAYDAAASWITRNGYEMAGPPREIWIAPPGPNAEMRIVWPFVTK
jgi:DNA-binding transcriptional MerR regulator